MSRETGAPAGTRVHHISTTGRRPIQSHPSFDQLNTERTWLVLDECAKVAKELGATVPQVIIVILM